MKTPPILSTIENTYKKSLSMHIALVGITIISLVIALVLDRILLVFGLAQIIMSIIVMVNYKFLTGKNHQDSLTLEQYQPYIEPINTALIIALLTPLRANVMVLILALLITIFFKELFKRVFQEQIVDPILLGLIFSQMVFGERLNLSDTFLALFEGTVEDVSVIRLIIGLYEGFTISSAIFIFLAFAAIYLILAKAIDRLILSHTMIHLGLFTLILFIFTNNSLSFLLTNLWLGPTAFSLVFLIPEYTTTPESKEAKMLYSFIVIGLFIMLRLTFNLLASILYALVITQLMSYMMERFALRSTDKTLKLTYIILVITWCIILISLIIL